jgi:flagellin
MPSILSTNMASLYAQRNLASAQAELAGSVQKLSSGKQINSAKDNAAGLGISEGVMGIKNITDQSIRSTQNAISVVQAAEGARQVAGTILQRMLTLTTQKENTILNAAQTASIDSEISSLLSEVGKIRDRTRFQGGPDSIFGTDLSLIAGAGVAARNISIRDLTIDDLGLSGVGSSKTVNSSDLASLFSRQISASGISVPTAQTMTSVPPSSVTGSTTALVRSAQAATLNGGVSLVASSPLVRTVQPAGIQSGIAPLSVSTVGGIRFSVNVDIYGVELYFTTNSASSIQGMSDGTVYTATNILGDFGTSDLSFGLSGPSGPIQNLGKADGVGLYFQPITANIPFAGTRVNNDTNVIVGDRFGLADGMEVIFQADSGATHTLGTLVHNNTYYIENVMEGGLSVGIKLKNLPTDLNGVDLNSTNAASRFRLLRVSPPVSFTGADITANALNLSGTAFLPGDVVQYQNNGLNITGLPNGEYVVKTETSSGSDSITLAPRSDPENTVTFGAITGSGTASVALVSRGNGSTNTINFNGHGFQNGDAVYYITSPSNPANEIGGLDAGTYYVVGVDPSGNSFQLSATRDGLVLPLSSSGSGSQTFTRGMIFTQPSSPFAHGTQLIYDGIATSGAPQSPMVVGSTYTVHLPNGGSSFQLLDSIGGVVSGTVTDNQLFRTASQQRYDQSDAITITGHGFQNGDVIKYGFSGGSQIGSLPTTGTYYVVERDVSGNSFKLASTFGGNAVDLGTGGSGTQTFTKAAVFNQPTTRYSQGAQVVYEGNTGGTNIGTLTVGATYKIHLVNSNNSFQLLDASGNYVAITSFSTGTPRFRNADQLPYVQTETITTTAAHGFQNGDAITYSSDNRITSLTNNGTYYVRDVIGNSFKLETSPGAGVSNLDGYGSGAQNFTKGTVFSQPLSPTPPFANGTKVKYGGVDGAGTAITGLAVSPAEYTVYQYGGNSFQLIDSTGKVFSTSDAGTGNQIFNTASTSLSLPNHGFRVGDQVTYSGANAGGSDIGNLPRGTYTVKAVVGNTFELENPANTAATLSFTSAGVGTQQFTSGSGGPISAASVAAAIQSNARYTAELGMQVNALNFAIDSMETLSSNLAQAYSRIMDVDYASETAALTRNQIMQQAATSMLAQANQMPNVILTLLK